MKAIKNYIFRLGILLILSGAAPLNGWIGFQFFPEQFHADPFIGSAWHFLIGALPFVSGILLLIYAPTKLVSLKLDKDSKFSVYIAGMMFLMLIPLFATGHLRWNVAVTGWLLLITSAICCVYIAQLLKRKSVIAAS